MKLLLLDFQPRFPPIHPPIFTTPLFLVQKRKFMMMMMMMIYYTIIHIIITNIIICIMKRILTPPLSRNLDSAFSGVKLQSFMLMQPPPLLHYLGEQVAVISRELPRSLFEVFNMRFRKGKRVTDRQLIGKVFFDGFFFFFTPQFFFFQKMKLKKKLARLCS